ncbi:hypothetical protein COCOBI_19-2000 [Coccomyxa sp. Obi]|nr:hypothetical protein COCOBI_19-2000 [Coccomyxa sp. Obi]
MVMTKSRRQANAKAEHKAPAAGVPSVAVEADQQPPQPQTEGKLPSRSTSSQRLSWKLISSFRHQKPSSYQPQQYLQQEYPQLRWKLISSHRSHKLRRKLHNS